MVGLEDEGGREGRERGNKNENENAWKGRMNRKTEIYVIGRMSFEKVYR